MSKLAIITGASSGIGQATAECFLRAGWKVVSIARRTCPVDGVESIEADLSLQASFETIKSELAPFMEDAECICLVHNAGISCNDTVRDVEQEMFTKIWDVNVSAPGQLNKIVMPHMSAGSSIIYIGSTLSEKAVSNAFSYTVSKHAIIGMMRATCQDLADSGIHTAAICPGATDTAMLRQVCDDEVLQSIMNMSAYKRLARPEELAKLIYQAAETPIINGSVIHANLGQIER